MLPTPTQIQLSKVPVNDKDKAVRRRAPKSSSKTLAWVAPEVFSIVLGVLTALAVLEWQESQEIQERTQAALIIIADCSQTA